MKIIIQALCYCLFLAPLAHSDNSEKTIRGEFSATFTNQEEAQLNAPEAPIDAACGQNFLAQITGSDFHCEDVRDGYQCQQIQTVICNARDDGKQP